VTALDPRDFPRCAKAAIDAVGDVGMVELGSAAAVDARPPVGAVSPLDGETHWIYGWSRAATGSRASLT